MPKRSHFSIGRPIMNYIQARHYYQSKRRHWSRIASFEKKWFQKAKHNWPENLGRDRRYDWLEWNALGGKKYLTHELINRGHKMSSSREIEGNWFQIALAVQLHSPLTLLLDLPRTGENFWIQLLFFKLYDSTINDFISYLAMQELLSTHISKQKQIETAPLSETFLWGKRDNVI